MCEAKRYKKIPNPRIDKCMKEFMISLNNLEIKTVSCCCGHRKYPMTIIAKIGDEFFELVSGKMIDRTRNFYKRDKEGFYFIPEVSNEM